MNPAHTLINGRTYVAVHKLNEDGTIWINAETGEVLRSEIDFPEWAHELAVAQLPERLFWLTSRFGPEFASANKTPAMFAFEELGWSTYSEAEDGTEHFGVIDADETHRMQVLAAHYGIDISTHDEELAFASLKGIVAETQIARDNTRTDAELADLKVAQAERFEVVEGGKTGTHG